MTGWTWVGIGQADEIYFSPVILYTYCTHKTRRPRSKSWAAWQIASQRHVTEINENLSYMTTVHSSSYPCQILLPGETWRSRNTDLQVHRSIFVFVFLDKWRNVYSMHHGPAHSTSCPNWTELNYLQEHEDSFDHDHTYFTYVLSTHFPPWR